MPVRFKTLNWYANMPQTFKRLIVRPFKVNINAAFVVKPTEFIKVGYGAAYNMGLRKLDLKLIVVFLNF